LKFHRVGLVDATSIYPAVLQSVAPRLLNAKVNLAIAASLLELPILYVFEENLLIGLRVGKDRVRWDFFTKEGLEGDTSATRSDIPLQMTVFSPLLGVRDRMFGSRSHEYDNA